MGPFFEKNSIKSYITIFIGNVRYQKLKKKAQTKPTVQVKDQLVSNSKRSCPICDFKSLIKDSVVSLSIILFHLFFSQKIYQLPH